MKIQNFLRSYVVLVATLSLAIIVSTVLCLNNILEVKNAQANRVKTLHLADELRHYSGYLTRFARSYAATSDPKFLGYFERVLAIMDGDEARPNGYEGVYWDLLVAGQPLMSEGEGVALSLEARLLEVGVTVEEFAKLTEAKHRSDDLAKLEFITQQAIIGRFDDGSGKFERVGDPDPAFALALLHSDEYHTEVALIMRPIGEFIEMVDKRTLSQLDMLTGRSESLMTLIAILSGFLAFIGLASALFMRKKVMVRANKLALTAHQVMKGNLDARCGLKGHDEIAGIGNAMDSMLNNLSIAISQEKEARAEAEKQTELLTVERNKSESLLLNILPAAYAERLKRGEHPIADHYNEVSVLFADMVGFTELSSEFTAHKVVDILNNIFGQLDALCGKLKLEKIKTIGDCYMVASGIPKRNPEHCQAIANFALGAIEIFKGLPAYGDKALQARIGINTGSVVAGVVGTDKFIFDIWGDAVNVASRLETTSKPGRIQVSEAVKFRLQDDFLFEDRGKVELKGKGKTQTYFLLDRVEK